MDQSNGYEKIAELFANSRGKAINGVGASTVRAWAQTLKTGAAVLELGCGTGIPMTKILLDTGLDTYAIDASPTLSKTFRHNFPDTPHACEAVEDSNFFNRKFDAIFAWGLMFLLPEHNQVKLIPKLAAALNPGGKLLFTSPHQKIEWLDAMTDEPSRSLGKEKYLELFSTSGLTLIEEFSDEGENHYFHAIKNS